MSRPHRRALAWLVRHPTVLLVAVAFTASVAVAAVGDVGESVRTVSLTDVDVGTSEVSSGHGGPNTVGDGG
jgi:hypothetical protein